MKLGEVEAQLTALSGSLKMIPALPQVTKAEEVKDLQPRINKPCTRHQRRTTQLDEIKGLAKQLALKAMEEITKTKVDLDNKRGAPDRERSGRVCNTKGDGQTSYLPSHSRI